MKLENTALNIDILRNDLQQDYRVKELPVAHLERQHWGRKIAAFLLRKMGIKNDRTAR